MVLVDTSVWIDHFRRGNRRLAQLLADGAVVIHPYIIGELACGHLPRRAETIDLLRLLPHIDTVAHHEVLFYIETHRLYGVGLGYIDANLLAATELADAYVWTLDRRFHLQAQKMRRALGDLRAEK